jgi:hypothetical protein
VIEDSCLHEQDPVMGPTQHRIGICLWSCKKISDSTLISFGYGLYFLHKTTTGIENLVKQEPKLIGIQHIDDVDPRKKLNKRENERSQENN